MKHVNAIYRCALAILPVLGVSAPASVLSLMLETSGFAQTAATQSVCAGQMPDGWIKIDDAWNPMTCGKPATKAFNVWMIAPLTDKPVGFSLSACRGPVPAGWSMVDTRWNPTACGHPTSNQNNVMEIERFN